MLFHYQVRGYFLYSRYTDMRKGIDSLCGIVSSRLNKNPLSGDLFIFINRRRNQVKMLHWQGDGFACFYKRLEKGTYETAEMNHAASLEISSQQLLFILEGVILNSVKKKKRYTHLLVEKN